MCAFTRIAFNRSNWQRPTGDAREYESPGTYNHKYGFGHEDWLFRADWLIDGWRYAFIQGVNKSYARLVREGKPFDVTLFTIHPDKRRRYVATIEAVECLTNRQAEDALKEFKRRGWFKIMKQEIRAVGGDVSALGAAEWTHDVLNVRYRWDNVLFFPPGTYAAADDPIQKRPRYQLYEESKLAGKTIKVAKRTGSDVLPEAKSYLRHAVSAVECTPEHARMQAKLMEELRKEYPKARVQREQDFVDVTVRTNTELLLFEIKSDLEPRSVIRQALGQILEYAFHPSRKHPMPPKLIIVGRQPLPANDKAYLARLQREFQLPVEYRVVSLSDD